MMFQDENFKTCLAFYFLALETLFLEHSKSVQITRKSQIYSLMITVSSKIMFSFPPELGQIYVKWYSKTQVLEYISACSVGRKTYKVHNLHCKFLQYAGLIFGRPEREQLTATTETIYFLLPNVGPSNFYSLLPLPYSLSFSYTLTTFN